MVNDDDRVDRVQTVVATVYATGKCPDGESLWAMGIREDDMEAVKGLLRLDMELQWAATLRSVREFCETADAFLARNPDWGR